MSEFYVKLGIIFMEATLSLSLIINVAPVAIIQFASSFVLGFFIYFIVTKSFKLDPKFDSTLARGGSICGASAAML